MFMQFAHCIFIFFQINSSTSLLSFLDCEGSNSKGAIYGSTKSPKPNSRFDNASSIATILQVQVLLF
jgi:hypothetical protein